jgi:hypothetical protein
MESKRVKEMQKREEFRQKGHDSSKKIMCGDRVENCNFWKGGGVETVVSIDTIKCNGALLSLVSYLINSSFQYF